MKQTHVQLGSLVRLAPDSQAALIGGILQDGQPAGFLFTCYDGRLVFQTLHTNQYEHWSMFQSWERYIDYALRKRMKYLEENH